MAKSKSTKKGKTAPVNPNPKTGERRERPVETKGREKAAAERNRVVEWADLAEDVPDLPDTLARYRELQADKKRIEAEMDELKPELGAAVVLAGDDVKTISDGRNQVTWVRVPRETIVAELLLENGVEIEVIKKCTRTTWSEYPLVSEVKE